MPVKPLTRFEAVVEGDKPNQRLQLFSEEVANLFPLIGEGSPEGIYEAKQGRFYFDTVGEDLYVKKLDDISGERRNGWVLSSSGGGGGGGVTDGDKGDITVSGSGTAWTIDNDAVTFAKVQNIATASFLGRTTAGTGDTEVLSVPQAKALLNYTAADVGASATGHSHLLTSITDVSMSVADLNSLDDGVNSALHFHDSDRSRANHTGTQLTSTLSDFSEAVDDRVAALVVAGTNMTITYNDGANTLTFDASGGGGGSSPILSWVI